MSEWISVKDRLPELYVPVLVLHLESGLFEGGDIAEAVAMWNGSCFIARCRLYDAKYWMPLPELPEKEPKTIERFCLDCPWATPICNSFGESVLICTKVNGPRYLCALGENFSCVEWGDEEDENG